MDLERWRQVASLLQSALERQPEERDAFLRQVCGGDHTLEGEVRSLLTMERNVGNFLETPLMQTAPPLASTSLSGKTISHYRSRTN